MNHKLTPSENYFWTNMKKKTNPCSGCSSPCPCQRKQIPGSFWSQEDPQCIRSDRYENWLPCFHVINFKHLSTKKFKWLVSQNYQALVQWMIWLYHLFGQGIHHIFQSDVVWKWFANLCKAIAFRHLLPFFLIIKQGWWNGEYSSSNKFSCLNPFSPSLVQSSPFKAIYAYTMPESHIRKFIMTNQIYKNFIRKKVNLIQLYLIPFIKNHSYNLVN